MKKKFGIFSALVAMLFAVCIVGASAAINTQQGLGTAYSSGLPVDLYYTATRNATQNYSTIVSNANVYYGASSNATSGAYTGGTSTLNFTFDFGAVDQNDQSYDIRLQSSVIPSSDELNLIGWSIDTPFAILPDAELNKLTTTIQPSYFSYVNTLETLVVRYQYEVSFPDPEGTQVDRFTTNVLGYETEYNIVYTPTTDTTYGEGYRANVYLNTFDITHIRRIYDYLQDIGVQQQDAYISGIDASLYTTAYELPSFWAQNIYITDKNRIDLTRDDILSIANSSLGGLLYPDSINYDHIDWVDWLTNSVKSFMSLELVPGLPIWGIFSAVLGIPILIWFLRMFAGG